MVQAKMLMLFAVSSFASSALAFDGFITPIDEIRGQRTLLENSGRKYASCFGRDADMRVRTEVEEAEMRIDGDYLEGLLEDNQTIYGLAIRGYMGHSGEVTHGPNPLEDSASIDAAYEVDVTVAFDGREFTATLEPELYCNIETEEGKERSPRATSTCSSRSGSVQQRGRVLHGHHPRQHVSGDRLSRGGNADLVVTVKSKFSGMYQCTGDKNSLAIGRAEVMTPWVSVFNMSEAVCYWAAELHGTRYLQHGRPAGLIRWVRP